MNGNFAASFGYSADNKHHKDVNAATENMIDASLDIIAAFAGRGYQEIEHKRQAREREHWHNEAFRNGNPVPYLEKLRKDRSSRPTGLVWLPGEGAR